MEVNCIAGHSYCEVGIELGVIHSVDELLSVENVDVDVMCLGDKVAVEYRYEVLASFFMALSESIRYDREGV